jgi:DNA-directed RNA polymerase specialized sigma24 family protein
MKRRTSQMAKFIKKENYREKYPDLSNEIIEVLKKSDRKMEYQQYDLKVERYKIDYNTMTVTYFPSREDSYDRLLDEDKQFQMESESVEDIVIKTVMTEKLKECLKTLSVEDQNLIKELFFNEKSERKLSAETGIPRMTIHDRKVKILGNLKKLLEK